MTVVKEKSILQNRKVLPSFITNNNVILLKTVEELQHFLSESTEYRI